MGELLKGVKRNLLSNKKNSFNIGFSNRSPFSYQLPSADPNSGVTQVNPPDMNDGTVERIQAQADATSSMLKTFSDVASTAIKEEKKKYSDQDIASEKALRIANRADKKEKRMTERGGGTDKQKERLATLRNKATDLEADIENKEYSDVSGADIERAQDEAAVAYSKWQKNNPELVSKKKNTKSNPCDDAAFKASPEGKICP